MASTSIIACPSILRALRLAPALCLGLALTLQQPYPLAAKPDPEELADRLGKWIIDRVPAYRDGRTDRALAGCIYWDSAAPDRIRVQYLYWHYLNPTLGGWSTLPSKLMNRAMALCAQGKASDATCECTRIARNNEPVLEIPSEVLARFAKTESPPARHATKWVSHSALTKVDFARLQPRGEAPLVPTNEVSLFTDAVYVVLNWDLGLRADTSYAVRYRLIDPTGATHERHEQRIYPSFEGGRSWHRFAIKNELERPGLWRVAIDIDGKTVAERPLQIQPNP